MLLKVRCLLYDTVGPYPACFMVAGEPKWLLGDDAIEMELVVTDAMGEDLEQEKKL